ncbi:MAG: hypothetical protein SWY16_18655 [Cyanobacteriota bacterium]|nr:hypothetical protein [Cyanobacteriota bacterium]
MKDERGTPDTDLSPNHLLYLTSPISLTSLIFLTSPISLTSLSPIKSRDFYQ